MHELSLCRAILKIAGPAAAGRQISQIFIDVGTMRQVIPQTLVYCWGFVAKDTLLEGSELVINHVPTTVKCRECNVTSPVTQIPLLLCQECKSGNVEVLTGEEFLLRSMETVD